MFNFHQTQRALQCPKARAIICLVIGTSTMNRENFVPSEDLDRSLTGKHLAYAPLTETYHSVIKIRKFRGRVAVLKSCRNQDDPRTAARFRNEVEALEVVGLHVNRPGHTLSQIHLRVWLNPLNQNHITQLLAADVDRLSLMLRLEPGQSLDKYVDPHGKSTLVPGDATTLWTQMSGALASIHAEAFVHDDVKPDNIMWDPTTQHSVLIDFGAALNHRKLPPDYFNPSGTPPYAPPEFLDHRKGSAGDVWALGVTMLFAFRYIKLPDGSWILPHVFEQAAVLAEMKSWLDEVEGFRKELAGGDHGLLAEMLERNPQKRISAAELERRLDVGGIKGSTEGSTLNPVSG